MDMKQHSPSEYDLANRHLKRKQLVCQRMLDDVGDSSLSITKSSFGKADFLKRCTNDEINQSTTSADNLVKIELDAALALAEFSRIVCLPLRLSEDDSFNLHWFRKKKRSKRSSKELACYKPDQVSFLSSSKHKSKDTKLHRDARCNSHIAVQECKEFIDETTGKFDSVLAGETNVHNSRLTLEQSKDSIPSGSGAESPSSPLPPQLECTLAQSRQVSAFQRVLLPVHSALKTATAPAEQKIEHMCCEVEHISNDQENKPGARAEESTVDLCALVEERRHRLAKRSRPSLTEMEKEVHRLQRVQANRESARQTIKRKQILCEELAKKAARLQTENDSMMQEKESLLQELYALSQRNQKLKQLLQSDCDSSQLSLPKLNAVPLQQAKSLQQASSQQNVDMESGKGFVPEICHGSMIPALSKAASEKGPRNAPFIPSDVVGSLAVLGSKPANSPQVEGDFSTELEMDAVHGAMPAHKDGEEARAFGLHTETMGSEDALGKVSVCQNPPATMGCQTMSFVMTPWLHSRGVSNKGLHGHQASNLHVQHPVCTSKRESLGPDCFGKASQLSRVKRSQHFFGLVDDEPEHTDVLTQQKIAAAAEARRRRKELTRSKVLRFRQLRLP